MARMTYADAVRHALAEEMRRDKRVWALGEDLSTAHGNSSANQYTGLIDEFGSKRIVNTPISESTIMGAAVGAAVAGTRPVADLRMIDFGLCAIDELVNQAAKIRYMFGGQARVPLVVREAIGLKAGMAAQHTQSYEAWFAHVPGLVVVTPATPADGRGLLKASIRCDDPVVFMEHKDLWGLEGDIDLDDEGLVPIGKAKTLRAGIDLTIVAWSRMTHVSMLAADELAKQNVSTEVIDLRTIYPWDQQAVLASVEKTGRLLVVQESVLAGGFANEIAAEIAQQLHWKLHAPVARLGAPRIPVGYAPALEAEHRVEAAKIVQEGLRLVKASKT
ncbi:MAG: alpha-ketoacid dehydrogenase subunit beta [Betaproteobacteria bacterium]|nr:alpha-ketoacid dehydrogenase subunit beta [Betaproteobacteria bacterium]